LRLPGGQPSADQAGQPDADAIYSAVAEWAAAGGRPLYPHQDEALLHLVTGDNVVLSTPTGSGKTLVAIAALFSGLATGRRVWYTAPVKALVSEKFFELAGVFGADRVGMITGDSAVNADAPVICCTAEILAGVALRRGGRDSPEDPVGVAVLDEFHYYGDRQRGWAWQVPLLELPGTQFLLMSGTLGDVSHIAADLSERTGRHTEVITGVIRPVPLHFSYVLTDVSDTVRELVEGGRAPAYLVHFTQAAAVERAQGLVGLGLVSRRQRDEIAELIGDFRFAKGFGRTLSRLVRAGIGVHHAGMLPRYRRLVERLAQAGLLAVICGTDTLGVGINVPIRTVLITALAKYDGHRSRLLSAREFHQIAGRAGRAGFDTDGYVVVLAPEHAIENAKAEAKAAADPSRKRKVVRRKAPEGQIGWTEQTFDRLVAAEPEPLTPHLRITHAVVLAALARPADAVQVLRELIESSHEPRRRQIQLIRRAIAIGRSLLAAGVVRRLDEPDELGRRFVLTADLQLDFALDQPLSPLALAAIELLDPAAEDYSLDVVSVIEATLTGPVPVLAAQRNRARGDAIAAMKAEGLEYEERMALLEDVDHPKPLADLMEHAYDSYRRGHPWVAEYQVEPKSVVREMFSRAMTFSEYVAEYQLARSEGVVLRYLAECYRALRRTVPISARTEELTDIISWLGEVVRGVDSSLLAEWEALAHPDPVEAAGGQEIRPGAVGRGITANPRAVTVMLRNALFRRVELAAHRRYDALGELDADSGWDAAAWSGAMAGYWAEYDTVGIGPDARSAALATITPGPESWRARQAFDDPAGDHDWGISAELDVIATDEAGEPVIRILDVGPFSGG
jgi:superfamily II RNA helicase